MTVLEHTTSTTSCDHEARITKSLLGYGVIAGPVFVVVSLAQGLTRQGFDLTRHAWSLLSNGDLGWIQVTNFVAAGLMTVALAVGLRRAVAGTWAPRLIGVYGLSLVAAGVFRADPALGFPAGTPADAHIVSWHGTLHLVSGSVGFLGLIAACLIVGRAAAADRVAGRRHPGARAGPAPGPGPGRDRRGPAHRRCAGRPRVRRPPGADRGTVHRRPAGR